MIDIAEREEPAMNVCKKKIEDRIKELEEKLSGVSQEQIEASQRDVLRWQELLDDVLNRELTEEEKAEIKKEWEQMDRETAVLYGELQNFRETLETPLMKAFTKFIMSDQPTLISPAGYHPDEKVYVQTKIAVHFNDRTPYVVHDGPLYIHEVNGFVQA
jgi:crotonobetainyl-CoA:carnitine CoA-transferase CaiB-like acyl-CoA transferase